MLVWGKKWSVDKKNLKHLRETFYGKLLRRLKYLVVMFSFIKRRIVVIGSNQSRGKTRLEN